MRKATSLAMVCGLAMMLWTITGCSTSRPGVTDTLGTYSAIVDSTPDKVTKAAQQAADDLKLAGVNATATKVDGVVTAKDAHGDAVNISVAQAGDNVSEVRIRVGVTGDGTVSMQLIERIKEHLKSWM